MRVLCRLLVCLITSAPGERATSSSVTAEQIWQTQKFWQMRLYRSCWYVKMQDKTDDVLEMTRWAVWPHPQHIHTRCNLNTRCVHLSIRERLLLHVAERDLNSHSYSSTMRHSNDDVWLSWGGPCWSMPNAHTRHPAVQLLPSIWSRHCFCENSRRWEALQLQWARYCQTDMRLVDLTWMQSYDPCDAAEGITQLESAHLQCIRSIRAS